MIAADVFTKEFPYFSLQTGQAPVRKKIDKWLNEQTNSLLIRKKLVEKNKEFSCVERVKARPSWVELKRPEWKRLWNFTARVLVHAY